MELIEVAQRALGSFVDVKLHCRKCTADEVIAGSSDGECVRKAIRKGWRKDGMTLICPKCSGNAQ
jgi:hypothetical protein